MAEITVIVPVYKVERYLSECVDSILSQTCKDFELVLVDDGSPDSCGKICDSYAQKDRRIHVIHQSNKGLSAARNAGIDYAMEKGTAAYLTFVDSDDWVDSRYLDELLHGARLSGFASCISCARVFDGGAKFVRYKTRRWAVVGVESYWCHPDPLTVVAWGKLYPREFFKEVRFPEGRIHEDVFTTHKLLFQSDRLAVKFVPLYFYRCRRGSICNDAWSLSRIDEIYGLREQCDYLRGKRFERAYLKARAGLIGAISGIVQKKDLIGDELRNEFSRMMTQELAMRPVDFWINRAYYRNVMRHGFLLRWIMAMIKDLFKRRSQSWVFRELVPTIREVLFSRKYKI